LPLPEPWVALPKCQDTWVKPGPVVALQWHLEQGPTPLASVSCPGRRGCTDC
jgi:hypothetical protein